MVTLLKQIPVPPGSGYTLQRKLFAVCQAKGNKRQQLLWHMFIKNSKKRTFFFVG